ncbi:MAG TPA: LPS assembly protein LptD [Gammaproteobacteria bacterium]|nr:LPS assembly protein LptD [Gammaproteobacteria bacterium]
MSLLGLSLPALAAPVCGPVNPLAGARLALPPPLAADAPAVASAERAEFDRSGAGQLVGEVLLQQQALALRANTLRFSADRRLDLAGEVQLFSPIADVAASRGWFRLPERRGLFEQTEFFLPDSGGRGEAAVVELQGESRGVLREVYFTTCEDEDTDWRLRADRIDLNFDSGRGLARNAQLRFQGVPLLYTPLFSFPISNERLSGFLAPRIGQSDTAGLDLAVPYYWNIAPNQDATITPRYLSRRGEQLQGEYRLLTADSESVLYGELLPTDEVTGTERSLLSLRNRTLLTPRWRAQLDATTVSDDRYLNDLGTELAITSSRYLDRRAELDLLSSDWAVTLRAQDFQVLNNFRYPDVEAFARLPQIRAGSRRARPLLGPVHVDGYAEAVRFGLSGSSAGQRSDGEIGLSTPLVRPWGYLQPRLAWRHTGYYDLSSSLTGSEGSPSRSLPYASVDSALRFERDTRLGGGLVQTLEPRLYALYVPDRSQDELPLFDTRLAEFDFLRLFTPNRYTGTDRFSPAQRVSVGVASRLLSPRNGEERLAAQVGQSFYLERPDPLTLDEAPLERDYSDVLGELRGNLSRTLQARLELKWDPQDAEFGRQIVGLRYAPGPGRLLNIAYRQRDDTLDDLEQLDLVGAWPIGARWVAVGRWFHSLAEDRNLETLAGVEYQSCCWSAQLAARRFIRDVDDDANLGVFFQLELKGFAALGEDVEQLLQSILVPYED